MHVVDLLGTVENLCIHALIVVTEQASKFHVRFGKIWGMQVVKAMHAVVWSVSTYGLF